MAYRTLLPVVSLPLLGNQNYFQKGGGDNTLVVSMAVIAESTALSNVVRFAWIPAWSAEVFLVAQGASR